MKIERHTLPPKARRVKELESTRVLDCSGYHSDGTEASLVFKMGDYYYNLIVSRSEARKLAGQLQGFLDDTEAAFEVNNP